MMGQRAGSLPMAVTVGFCHSCAVAVEKAARSSNEIYLRIFIFSQLLINFAIQLVKVRNFFETAQ